MDYCYQSSLVTRSLAYLARVLYFCDIRAVCMLSQVRFQRAVGIPAAVSFQSCALACTDHTTLSGTTTPEQVHDHSLWEGHDFCTDPCGSEADDVLTDAPDPWVDVHRCLQISTDRGDCKELGFWRSRGGITDENAPQLYSTLSS